MNLRNLRTLQDWFVRYQVNSVPGVAEVASVGGYVQQYQVDVDPNKLRAYALPLSMVVEAVQRSNNNVGGNVVEQSGEWAVVRGVGLIESVGDVEKRSDTLGKLFAHQVQPLKHSCSCPVKIDIVFKDDVDHREAKCRTRAHDAHSRKSLKVRNQGIRNLILDFLR
jgi:AcrB/AcrD/AcrF family